jgi:hypothetical protein
MVSVYCVGMDTAKLGIEIIERAERDLRGLVGKAAEAAEYDAVERLTQWARMLRELARNGTPATQVAAPADRAGHGPDARTRSARGVASDGQRRTTRKPAKGQYPKFFRSAEQLVKIGWSKKDREEYEHRASRLVAELLAAAIARRAGNGRLFTTDDLFPLKNAQDGGEVPSYQAYVALAWLKALGLVKPHGRRGYSANSAANLCESVSTAWMRLSEQQV